MLQTAKLNEQINIRKWQANFENHRGFILKSVGCVVLGLVLWIFRSEISTLLRMVGDRDAIVSYLKGYGILGPILLSIILFLQVMVAAIPGHVFMVAGAYVYGPVQGFAIVLLSTVLSSQVAFALARKIGRPFVTRFVPEPVLDKWDGAAEQQGAVFFMFTFILPIFPSDVMNFVAGLSSLSPRRFFCANLFGRIPGVILMTLIGYYGFSLPPQLLALTLGIIVVLFVIWRVHAKKCQVVGE